MPGTSGAAGALLAFLPHVIVAALVVVGGWVLAQFLAQAVLIAAVNAQVPGASLLAAVSRWLVLTVAAAVALTELGVAREMVLLVFGIAFGGAVLACRSPSDWARGISPVRRWRLPDGREDEREPSPRVTRRRRPGADGYFLTQSPRSVWICPADVRSR